VKKTLRQITKKLIRGEELLKFGMLKRYAEIVIGKNLTTLMNHD